MCRSPCPRGARRSRPRSASTTKSVSTSSTSHTQTVTGLTPSTPYHFRVRSTDASHNSPTRRSSELAGAPAPTTYVSDLGAVGTSVNGWGPFERDMSNGEQLAGDGHVLTVQGVTFSKGLGVNAASDVSFAVPSGCTSFSAQIGVDDEVGVDVEHLAHPDGDGADPVDALPLPSAFDGCEPQFPYATLFRARRRSGADDVRVRSGGGGDVGERLGSVRAGHVQRRAAGW